MKVCIIGNSHITALKLGWPDDLAVKPTFFGSHRSSLKDLALEGRSLRAEPGHVAEFLKMTSGGKSEIDIDDYDAFWLVGLISDFMAVFRTHRLFRDREDNMAIMSQAVFDAATGIAAWSDLSARLVRKIRSVTSAPIVVIPAPMPSEEVFKCPAEGRMWATDYPAKMYEKYQVVLEKLAAEGATIFSQPMETLREKWLTKAEFSFGSVKMVAGYEQLHRTNEFRHMNAKYGRIVIRALIDCNYGSINTV